MPADHHGVVGSAFYGRPVETGRARFPPAVIFPFTLVQLCVCGSMEGGELFSRIQAKGDQAFTEKGEAWTDPKRIVGSRKWKQATLLSALPFSGIAAGLRLCFLPPRGL